MLICSAGRRVELMGCFRRAADDLGLHLVVHAADLALSTSAACRMADRMHAVPRADSASYADEILALALREGIRLVVPTIDTELAGLAAARPRFDAAGIRLAIGSTALVDIARDKLKTASFLAERDVAVPRTASLEDALQDPSAWKGKLFLKPRHGSSGRGIRPVDDVWSLAREQFAEPMLVQERLQGPEFTVNCFFDRHGELRAAVPHERLAIRGGEVEKGITRREPELAELAHRLAKALPGPAAALCFQAMRAEDGRFCLFEINARFGGGYPLAHEAGAPFARWLLEECTDMPSTANDDWSDGVMMLRHDHSLFVRNGQPA